ncbi:hypothetical protein O3P69_013255 [Scylla paramamosain]|uniref:Uncharacterized protein n=1 Tax=Scylla paramamosain TaxID=85552 RepID=A0AAW0TZZ7_SCYPA
MTSMITFYECVDRGKGASANCLDSAGGLRQGKARVQQVFVAGGPGESARVPSPTIKTFEEKLGDLSEEQQQHMTIGASKDPQTFPFQRQLTNCFYATECMPPSCLGRFSYIGEGAEAMTLLAIYYTPPSRIPAGFSKGLQRWRH